MGNTKLKETMNSSKVKVFAGIVVCAAGVKIQEWDPISDIEDFIGDQPTVEEWWEGFEDFNEDTWNYIGEELEWNAEFLDWYFSHLVDGYEFDPIGDIERDFKEKYEAENFEEWVEEVWEEWLESEERKREAFEEQVKWDFEMFMYMTLWRLDLD